MRALVFVFGFFMVLGALMPGNDFSQLVRLVGLIDHYQEHCEEEGESIDFWAFLDEHYSNTDAHSHSEHDHSDLPLKQICPVVWTYAAPKPEPEPVQIPFAQHELVLPIEALRSGTRIPVWRPPLT